MRWNAAHDSDVLSTLLGSKFRLHIKNRSVYVSTITIWSRRVDNAVEAVATTFLHLNAQSSNLCRVVRGKPNHLLVHMISGDFHCVFLTSKLATKGRQRLVLSGNEANRTNTNIKQTTNCFAPVVSLYMTVSIANRRCLQTEPGGSLYLT